MKLLNRYPIDTRAQVKTAAAYFDDHYKRFNSADRVVYARGLAARMYEMHEPVTEKIAHYAQGVPRSIEPAVRARSYILNGSADNELVQLVKSAEYLSPDELLREFMEFDATHGLRDYSRIPDPYDSVYMSEKTAEELSGEETWTGPASDRITKSQFQNWVMPNSNHVLLLRQFDTHTAEGLCGADGWQVFKSLPDPHKQIIARMVNDNVIPGDTGAGLSRYSVAGNIAEEQVYESAHERLERMMAGADAKLKN
jgi:hypothetical protein